MKKVLVMVMAFMLVFSATACFGGGAKEGEFPGSAYIDDCYVEITDCKAQISTTSYQTMAVVYVDFTNNSNEATSLFFTADIKVYQNGIELDSPISWVPADHGIQQDKADNIQPGYSLSTGYAFVLSDTSAPVTVQICSGSKVISEKEFYV